MMKDIVYGKECVHHNEHHAVETVNDGDHSDGKEERLHRNEVVSCDEYVETTMKGDVDGDDDDGDDEFVEEEHFDSNGLWVPGGMMRDYALENVIAACAQPIIDLSRLRGSDFSDDSDYIGDGSDYSEDSD